MNASKDKGTSFERQVVEYMRNRLGDDRIERRALGGANDRGDVSGVYIHGRRTVIECKNKRRMELSEWVDEMEAERGNDGADFGFVVHKRRGCGEKNMGETYVTCTLENLCTIIVGDRFSLGYDAAMRAMPRQMMFERGIDYDG